MAARENFASQVHAPRDDEEFPGKRDDRLAEDGLLRLTDTKLTERAGVPPGKGVGDLDEECVEQRAARLAVAALATQWSRAVSSSSISVSSAAIWRHGAGLEVRRWGGTGGGGVITSADTVEVPLQTD